MAIFGLVARIIAEVYKFDSLQYEEKFDCVVDRLFVL